MTDWNAFVSAILKADAPTPLLLGLFLLQAYLILDEKKWKKAAAKRDKETEQRAARREEESRLSMRMMGAAIDLGLATAMAVSGHKTNGEMKAAQEQAKSAQAAYQSFLEQTAAESLSGKG